MKTKTMIAITAFALTIGNLQASPTLNAALEQEAVEETIVNQEIDQAVWAFKNQSPNWPVLAKIVVRHLRSLLVQEHFLIVCERQEEYSEPEIKKIEKNLDQI